MGGIKEGERMNPRVLFQEEICKGCGLCISVCPKDIISLASLISHAGYHPAQVVNQDQCISCAFCAIICPDSVITVYRSDKKKERKN
jgi:2-oxoglutarate ferredoxin oxidoreductase subunit delta